MKTGPLGGWLKVLPENEIHRIHEAALSLLENPGIQSESDLFLDIFARGGASVNRGEHVIRLPREMIEAAIKSAPSSFVLHGRHDPTMDLLLEPNRVHYGMGGTSEPMFLDYELGHPRQPTKSDMVNSTRIAHALPNIDFVQTLCMSGDKPTNQIFFHDFDAISRNTTKPTVMTILERPFTQSLLRMAAAASGGEEALRERPSVLGIVTPVSPLKISIMHEGLIDAVQAGIPILYAPGPMMGATGPATIAGIVALSAAEVLFGVVLTQLIKPGAKVVLKPDTNVFDMQSNQCTYGSPEQDLGKLAMAQLAHMWDIPHYSMGGGVEGKVPDAETASEAMLNMLLNALAGINLNQSLGSMSFGQYGCQEMVVICDELVREIKHVLRGITVNDDTLAVDVIREAGHGGSFLQSDHTLRHFRQEEYFPMLFRRQSIDRWLSGGRKNAYEVAHSRVQDILATAGPVDLPASADSALEDALTRALSEADRMASA